MQTKSSFRLLCTFIGLCSVLSTSCDETVVSIEDDTPACKNACKSESFRCYDERQIEICIVKSNGCTSWSDPQLCPSSSVCIDNTCQSCPDTSCEPNQRSCDAKGARVCSDFDGNGCFEWSQYTPCPSGCNGDVCNGCTNQCEPNQRSCDAKGARVCGDFDGNGCFEWSQYTPCPSGCNGDVCNGCTNQCEPNQRSCDAKGARVCGDFDGNGCFEWSQYTPCKNGCNGDVCNGCTNQCEPNQRSCDAKGARVCGDFDGNGCFEWSNYTPCKNGCNGDACNGCTNQCEPNQRSCDAQGARICGDFDGNGCFEWSNYTPCPSGCDGDVCRECQNACTNGKKSCDAKGARICGDFDGNGCFEWSNYTPCPSGCDGNVCKAAPSYEPTRYPGNAILSPITPYVVDKMKAIRNKNKSRNDNSFMKLGDSHMYEGSSFMYCFSNKSPKHTGYDLAGIPVTDAVSAFQSSFDAFARVSVTTVLGKTANLPIANGNSLLNQEISATNPRFAFYGFGTNDMGWFDYRKFKTNNQGGYFYAMQLYYRNVLAAIDALIAAGIIPIVIGTGWRNEKAKYYGTQTQVADKDLPKHFVTSFNAVSRGIAEFYQIPYYNLQLSHDKIENFGLSTDGIHHKTIHNGCDFTTNGLTAGANRRNRYAIEQLQNAWRTTVKSSPAPATQTHPFQGNGSHANPYIIPDLPYTHMASTANAETKFDTYSCNTSVKEFGPEKLYKLTVSKQTRIRAFAMSTSGVDVDIHLLSAPNANACLARGDKWIEAKLSAGTYYFAIDTYNENRTNSNAGTYLFGIHTCDPDDADCGSRNIGE